MGGGPTPLALTRSPQKGWSPKKGTMAVGHYIAKIRWITISWKSITWNSKHLERSKIWSHYRSFKTSSCCSSTSMMHLKTLRKRRIKIAYCILEDYWKRQANRFFTWCRQGFVNYRYGNDNYNLSLTTALHCKNSQSWGQLSNKYMKSFGSATRKKQNLAK